jgi:hypothetical protein
MDDRLDRVLVRISEIHQNNILKNSRNYREVDIGRKAEDMGIPDIGRRYHNIYAIVPLRRPEAGMKVRIDGRTFIDYVQFDSGVAVPGYVAEHSGLRRSAFVPNDSMICNFT